MGLETNRITCPRKTTSSPFDIVFSRRRKMNRGMALDPQIWIALLTLTALDIVLSIDNIVLDVFMAKSLDRRVWAKPQRNLCVEKERLAFPDRLRECEIVQKYPMAQTRRFADVAVRSVRRKSRSVRDGRMFLQAAFFVYGRDAPICPRVFRLPRIS